MDDGRQEKGDDVLPDEVMKKLEMLTIGNFDFPFRPAFAFAETMLKKLRMLSVRRTRGF